MGANETLKEFLYKLKFTTENAGQAEEAVKRVNGKTSELSRNVKQLTRAFAKNVLGIASWVTAIIKVANRIKNLIKYTIEMNRTLNAEAKSMDKSTEAARAHTLALKVMGKSMSEINKSEELKKTYDEMIKLGEAMALPESAKGTTAVNDLITAFQKLRYVIYYGAQWVLYYFQKYLKSSLGNLLNFTNKSIEELKTKIKSIAKTVAKYFAYAYKAVESLIATVASFIKTVKSLWNSFGAKGKGTITLILAVLTLVLNKGLAIKALIAGLLLIVQDFFSYLNGGKHALKKETYDKIINFLLNAYNVIAKIVNAILKAINTISRWTGNGNVFEYGMHTLSDEEKADLAARASTGELFGNIWQKYTGTQTADGQPTSNGIVIEGGTEAAEALKNANAQLGAGGGGGYPSATYGDNNTVMNDNRSSNYEVSNTFNISSTADANGTASAVVDQFGSAMENLAGCQA